MSDHKQLQAAVKEAVDAGLCPIPPAQDGSKRPKPGNSFSWAKFQKQPPSQEERESWYTDDNRTGIGIVCGAVSGNLKALDFDDPETWHKFLGHADEYGLSDLVTKLTTSYMEETPGGAAHLLYRCSQNGGSQKLATRPKNQQEMSHEHDKVKTLIEVKGEGGYIVVAPSYGSVHSSGKPYVLKAGSFSSIPEITPEDEDALFDFARSFHIHDEKKVAADVKSSAAEAKGACKPGDDFTKHSTWEEFLPEHGWKLIKTVEGVGYWQKPGGSAGAIHATTNYAGSDLLYVFSTATIFEPERGYSRFAAYTTLNHDSDFKAAAKALAADGYGENASNEGKTGKSPTEVTLELIGKLDMFHDQNGEPYFHDNGQSYRLRSSGTRKKINYEFYKATGRVPSSDVVTQTIATLEGIAMFDREERQLENRVTTYGDGFLYDMGDHRAIYITPQGWVIINAPSKFRRYSHQAVQVTPVVGGDAFKLFDFINVAKTHRLLILVTLITYFIPGIPHPIFHPWGPQGSGKTSLFRAFKRLVDPSSVETLMSIIDTAKAIHALVSHYMPLFDNLSGLKGEISDLLCQACTGGGIEQRKLYTDDDSIIFQILRCVGINGINLSVVKADILDRTLLLPLERIPPDKRREDSVLWAEFEAERPLILGGIFDILSRAMAIYPGVKLEKLPRLADYGRWGYAIAEAIEPGLGQQFVDDFERNIQQQVDEAIQSNTLAVALLGYMEKLESQEWETTIKIAHDTLYWEAGQPRFDKSFPPSPRDLRRYLERLKTTLEDRGLIYAIGKRTAAGYPIIFRKVDNFATSDSSDSPMFHSSEPDVLNEAKFSPCEVAMGTFEDYGDDL